MGRAGDILTKVTQPPDWWIWIQCQTFKPRLQPRPPSPSPPCALSTLCPGRMELSAGLLAITSQASIPLKMFSSPIGRISLILQGSAPLSPLIPLEPLCGVRCLLATPLFPHSSHWLCPHHSSPVEAVFPSGSGA